MEQDNLDKTTTSADRKITILSAALKNISLEVVRLTLKASIAINITLIFVFATKSQLLIGPACALSAIATLIYMPVRPVGVQIKIIIQGLLSAGVGSAWCYLGNFLANLARDPAVESPLQPASSAVSAVFCAVLMFVLGYVRARYPQADFLTIFASMIAAFSLTQNAAIPGFQPSLTLTFLKPMLFSAAVSLAVTILLWPEDTVTNYLNALTDVLDEYNDFFMENTTAFLCNKNLNQHNEPYHISLPILRTRLQSKFVKLVDFEHTMNFAITYHQLTHKEVSQLTKDVKSMHTPLHGIGVSNLCKHETRSISEEKKEEIFYAERNGLTMEVIESCNLLLKECHEYISSNFKAPPRTALTTFLWPFPRFFYTKPSSTSTLLISLNSFDNIVERFKTAAAVDKSALSQNPESSGKVITEKKQLKYLFYFNLIGYADQLRTFALSLDHLSHHKVKKLSLPHVSLRSWLRPSASDKATLMGGQFASGSASFSSSSIQIDDSSSGHSTTDIESDSFKPSAGQQQDENGSLYAINGKDITAPRDPDVDAPRTATERFFNYCSIVFNWFYSMPTLFALKTAGGFILLSLPAYFPSSATTWFTPWGGQWVANVFVMWIFPMSGMFNFTIGLGLIGSIIGTIYSIVAWEIVRGNVYGLSVMSFIVMIISNFVSFTNHDLSFMSIMIQYTYIMIITTGYQDAVGGALQYESIEMAAGKRMLFVVLGILGASLVNWFPRPVTGRVELRKMVSNTLRDINMLYGVIFADVLTGHEIPLDQVKAYKKLSLGIQRQLKLEEIYLNFTKLEPPLKGKFPFDTYRELIERLNNMADVAEGMAYCARSMDKSWSKSLITAFQEENFDYVFCSINIMCTLSATLKARRPLPPMISHDEMKHKIDEKLGLALRMHPDQLQSKTFFSFNAFSVACSRFTHEMMSASGCVERLLGVELPENWLRTNYQA